jgi:DNA primase
MVWIDDLVAAAQQGIDDEAREKLWSRGVDDPQIDLFRLGYLGESLPPIDFPDHFLKWSKGGARLVGCFLIPLTNPLGHIRGLQLRSADRSVSGYSDYFLEEPPPEPVLFGLSQAIPHMWAKETVLLVEGGFDLFPMQRIEPATVATLTAKVSPLFVRFLRRFVKHVVLAYDRDKGGRTGTSRFIDNYGSEFESVRTVEFPEVRMVEGKLAKDPADFWEAWGDEQLGRFVRCTTKNASPTE